MDNIQTMIDLSFFDIDDVRIRVLPLFPHLALRDEVCHERADVGPRRRPWMGSKFLVVLIIARHSKVSDLISDLRCLLTKIFNHMCIGITDSK